MPSLNNFTINFPAMFAYLIGKSQLFQRIMTFSLLRFLLTFWSVSCW